MWLLAAGSLSGRNGAQPSGSTSSMSSVARRRACCSMRNGSSAMSIAIDSRETNRRDVGDGRQLEAASISGEGKRHRLERERLACPLPAHQLRSHLDQVRCQRQHRHPAMGRQPLVAATDDGISAPSPHAHRSGAGELGRVDHDPGAGAVGVIGDGSDVDMGAGRVLHGAETHHLGRVVDRVDQTLGQVLVGTVVHRPDRGAVPLCRHQPRIGDARKVGGDEQDRTVDVRNQGGDLPERLAGTTGDRHPCRRHIQQLRGSTSARRRGRRPRPRPTTEDCRAARRRPGSRIIAETLLAGIRPSAAWFRYTHRPSATYSSRGTSDSTHHHPSTNRRGQRGPALTASPSLAGPDPEGRSPHAFRTLRRRGARVRHHAAGPPAPVDQLPGQRGVLRDHLQHRRRLLVRP